eukprot:gnl/TRDRNA2_/TRDRNA2_72244_c1_seq1.p1 gnl/TRDRNA2_/TRDRNA2_72244_c1~~gnl/TRDRNA2_/TRDRNA2_72244_c1_seq1.p1  ORF type:complete len:222 (+),score=42.39 gnl/TRDRNA2_/TRDRNA2_72244_c1_seq1:53-667(+)
MALAIKVCTMGGEALCEVSSLAPTSTVQELMQSILESTGVPVHEQKLMKRQITDGAPMALLGTSTLCEVGIDDGSEVLMVRMQPFNGKYKVGVLWNNVYQIEILGSHARVTNGEKLWESEIEWLGPRVAKFSGTVYAVTEWSQIHNKDHKKDDGLWEKFEIEFGGDSGAKGFDGTFQRQYEGPLECRSSGPVVEDEGDARIGDA